MKIEFHLSISHTVHIVCVVISAYGTQPSGRLRPGYRYSLIDEALSDLPHLQQVVLQGAALEVIDEIEDELLRVRNKVYRRSPRHQRTDVADGPQVSVKFAKIRYQGG